MSDFTVSQDDLTRLSDQLRHIESVLEGTKKDLRRYEESFCSSTAAGAFSKFVSGWSDGRTRIQDEAGSLADDVASAAAAYREADQSASLAAGGGGR